MKKRIKGQAAILIIFVIGMVSLLIGVSLSKTGFAESLMGRGINNSTQAFYVANSGVEDAFYRIRQPDFDISAGVKYALDVDEGTAKVNIRKGGICSPDETEIESVGKYKNYIRKVRVCTFDTSLRPGFIRAIQAGLGGVELENTTVVTGRDKNTGSEVPGDVYSNSYVRGVNNGKESDCSKPAAATRINGTVWAVGNIEALGTGNGPCIDKNAYAGSLVACRVLGSAFSGAVDSAFDCPSSSTCDPMIDPECRRPEIKSLPDMGFEKMKELLNERGTIVEGDCTIGGINDCSETRADGKKSIGNILITGNLVAKEDFFVSGPVWVKKNIEVNPNITISLVSEITDISQIILASGRIISSSNITFTSKGRAFLLFASDYENEGPDVCKDEDNAAINLSANVYSILFFATKGCVLIENPTASSEFYGAVLGEGIRLKNNSKVVYDPELKNAEFALTREGGWQILSFTEW